MGHFKPNILLAAIFLLVFCNKKENQQSNAPQPASNATPCNASNLVVDSIKETTGQSRIYKLTVSDYTLTSPSGQTVSVAGVYQVTMAVLGDTLVNNYLGKRYRIRSTQGWDFKAYSYMDISDSLWHLTPFVGTSGGESFFTPVIKLPLLPNQTYSYSSFGSHNCAVSNPTCVPINYVNQPIFVVNDWQQSSPDVYIHTFYLNKTGLLKWSYYVLYIQTQNPENHAQEWYFEKIN